MKRSRAGTTSARPSGPASSGASLGLAIGVAVGLAVTAVVLWTIRGDDASPTAAAPAGEPGVEHVHGLGIDPADGALLAATHYGTFRIPRGGTAARIGGSFQDTMGFTVVGPGHFLGSGHPDVEGLRAGLPGLLGLIESRDGGESWEPVSLLGEADFHALTSVQGVVYGWDATTGRFLVSPDRQRWETRSTLDLTAFAVDPGDPERVVAATPAGVRRSADGGRTWSDGAGSVLVALAWDDIDLWGLQAGGAVVRSDDAGASWQDVGHLPGEPQALVAAGDLYAAAHENSGGTAIFRSGDDGATWQLEYRDGG